MTSEMCRSAQVTLGLTWRWPDQGPGGGFLYRRIEILDKDTCGRGWLVVNGRRSELGLLFWSRDMLHGPPPLRACRFPKFRWTLTDGQTDLTPTTPSLEIAKAPLLPTKSFRRESFVDKYSSSWNGTADRADQESPSPRCPQKPVTDVSLLPDEFYGPTTGRVAFARSL